MKRSCLFFALLLWLMSQSVLQAQSVAPRSGDPTPRIHFEQLTTADGLPGNTVMSMIQDHLGFIWLATWNGLARYDGTQTTSFYFDPTNKYSYNGHWTTALYEDRNGDIWIGAENLFRYERATGRFIEYPRAESQTISPGNRNLIKFIQEDRLGNIWTITRSWTTRETVLDRLNPKTATWTQFQISPKEAHSNYSIANNVEPLSFDYTSGGWAFLESKAGTIWVIMKGDTQNTLYSLDPKTNQFTRFTPKTSPALAASFKQIGGIAEDKLGQLYFPCSKNRKGLFRLNPQTGQLTQFTHDPHNPASIRSDSLFQVHPSRDGRIWITTAQGLDRLDPKTGQFTHFPSKRDDPTTPSPDLYGFLHETPSGDLWFVAKDGVTFYDQQRGQFVRYGVTDGPHGLKGVANFHISSFLADRTGLVWIGTGDGGVNKQSRTPKFSLLTPESRLTAGSNPEPETITNKIYEAPSQPGVLWIGTDGGLARLDQKTGHRTYYHPYPKIERSLGPERIYDIAEDQKNRLWIATIGGGLHLLDRQRGTFTHFTHDPARANSLMDNFIRTLVPASDGTLWLGTYQGVDHFDPDRQHFTHYYRADSLYTPELYARLQTLMATNSSLAAIPHPGNNVNESVPFSLSQPTDVLLIGAGEWDASGPRDYGWLEDERGRPLWTMTQAQSAGDGLSGRVGNQVGMIHLKAGQYRLRYRSNNDYAYGAWSAGSPYHPDLWGIRCLALSPADTQGLMPLTSQRQFGGLARKTVRTSSQIDSQKRVWLGISNFGGLQVMNLATGLIHTYLVDSSSRPILKGLFCMLPASQPGYLWMGNYFTGLWLLNEKSQVVKHYDKTNGLPSNTVYDLRYDALGKLWVSTDNGLARLDQTAGPSKTGQFRVFTQQNGLPSMGLYTLCTARNGKIYVGGQNGAVVFDPAQLDIDSFVPPVVLTDLAIHGRPATLGQNGQLPVAISLAKNVSLPYDQNDLTFQFAALSYNRGNESRYAYQLAPIDSGWVQNGSIRQVRYGDLRPGTYTFRVKAANADGVWNETGTSVQVTIRPPWWETWWAYLLYALVFALLLRTYIAYRSRALRRENQRLEEKVLLRTHEVEQQKEEIAAQRDSLETTLNELQATQTQLIHKEKMASLGELTAGIAHEIQNPLNFVNNFSELSADLVDELEEEQQKPQPNRDLNSELLTDLKDNLTKILHHGKRASGIVRGMLEHARSANTERQLVELNTFIEEYWRLAYHGQRAKDNRFTCEFKTAFDPGVREARVMPQELGRVLLNLFSNAFYALQQRQRQAPDATYQPTIQVTTQRNGEQVILTVADNGIGMSEAVRAKIFQPFFTTKPTGEGTGLGLSLSYDIITKGHGGSLSVSSQPGQGTQFTIGLPLKSTVG